MEENKEGTQQAVSGISYKQRKRPMTFLSVFTTTGTSSLRTPI